MVTKRSNTATKQTAPTIDQPMVSETPKTTTAAPMPPETAAKPPATAPTAWVPPRASDGFDAVLDANGNRSIIRGIKIKFTNNAEWIDDAGEVIPPDREFLVVELTKVVQKWIDALPAEQRILEPHEPFPDVERLNAEVPQSEWTEKFGKLVGPWQNSIALHLFDPKTLEGFTWPTSTAGGFRCIDELQGRVRRARRLQGDNVFPLVTLADIHMNTQFSGRQRPHFKVLRFVALGSATEQQSLLAPADKVPPMNDEIPY